MTERISFPSTGSRRWSLRAARWSTVCSRFTYSSDSRLLDWSEKTSAVFGVLPTATVSRWRKVSVSSRSVVCSTFTPPALMR